MADGFEISGLEELEEDLEAVVSRYPDETAAWLRKEANQWKKDCNSKGYSRYTDGKRPIPKSWKTEKEENIVHEVNSVSIRNTSPHFHLVENGHRKVLWGKETGGFVPGKHYAEQTRAEWQDKFPEHAERYVDQMLKGQGL